MRIIQVSSADLSTYESKSQRLDAAYLASGHEVSSATLCGEAIEDASGNHLSVAVWRKRFGQDPGTIVHFYGTPPRWAAALRIPAAASSPVRHTGVPWRGDRSRTTVVSPVGAHAFPEAVDPQFFAGAITSNETREGRSGHRLGTYGPLRTDVRRMAEQTLARLMRFRDDCQWDILDTAPTARELASYDVWIDPTSSAEDFDGQVAEALVSGCVIVACRTAINVRRLGNGEAGFLVPTRDANEMTHAIAAALFRDDAALAKRQAARVRMGEFRPEVRGAALESLYERMLRTGHDR